LADLSSQEKSPFPSEADERYQTTFMDRTVRLELFRPGLFAWSEVQPYRYRDFSVDARIQLPPGNPAASAGFIVRMADAGSFVCILASDQGLRMDVFFNGEPRTIVPWTPCPWISMKEGILLSVVARGSHYLVLADGRFACEAEDDTTEAGVLAFAARSGEPAESAGPAETAVPAGSAQASGVAILQSLSMESRPVEVEVAFYRYSRLAGADVQQRRRLARSLFSNGDYLGALIHLKKLDEALTSRKRLKQRPTDGNDSTSRATDAFLRAECYLRLEMYEDAQEAIETSLSISPGLPEAREERYNLMYLRGQLEDLRSGLAAEAGLAEASPRLSNLLGHACFGLGAWHEAALAYGTAARLDPAMPIYAMNAARTWEKAGDMHQAAAAWIQAAHGFFDQSAWEDAWDCAHRLKELKYDPAATESLEGRIAYGMGDFDTAEKLFARLARKRAIDAPASCLYGLLLARKGKLPAATTAFRTAVALDPAEGLYHFRLAESLMLGRAGQNPDQASEMADELAKAMELDPGFPWTHNLAGQLAMEHGSLEEAAGCFRRAASGLPEAPEPAINLSAALAALGRHEEALAAVERLADSHSSAANQGGNVLALCNRLDEAEAWYRKAISLAGTGNRRRSGTTGPMTGNPDNTPVYRTNLAAALIELGRLPEAQDELRHALESRMDARPLYLMGDIAQEFGDLPRAEAAYTSALELDPGNPGILKRLGAYYLMRQHYQRAEEMAGILAGVDPTAAEKIRASIREATREELSCDTCGRSWTVPKPLPPVPRTIVRGEMPDESPAGSCSKCGAVLCVACGKKQLVDDRFCCLKCGGKITLNDDRIRWIVRDFLAHIPKGH
jgi:tetratricopeptide (TPR) repeat protein